MIEDPARARAAFDRLGYLLEAGGDMTSDDAISLRLAHIDIQLRGLEVTAQRTDVHSIYWRGVRLKCIEIGQQISALALDILAWYSLPAEREGTNEPPIGPSLRSDYLEQLAVDECRLMELRDGLATFLLAMSEENTGTWEQGR